MKKVEKIFEKKEVLPYLKARKLVSQYRKAKQYLLDGNTLQVKFKERNPKGSGILGNWNYIRNGYSFD